MTVEIDPRTVPELLVILRTDKLSKVRVLDVVCDQDHRLVQVLRFLGGDGWRSGLTHQSFTVPILRTCGDGFPSPRINGGWTATDVGSVYG